MAIPKRNNLEKDKSENGKSKKRTLFPGKSENYDSGKEDSEARNNYEQGTF